MSANTVRYRHNFTARATRPRSETEKVKKVHLHKSTWTLCAAKVIASFWFFCCFCYVLFRPCRR